MSPASAAFNALMYAFLALPGLTKLALPQVNSGRASFRAIMSAYKRACLPLPLGNGWIKTSS